MMLQHQYHSDEYNYKIYHDYFGENEIIDCKFLGFECLFCGADEEDESFEEILASDYNLFYTQEATGSTPVFSTDKGLSYKGDYTGFATQISGFESP